MDQLVAYFLVFVAFTAVSLTLLVVNYNMRGSAFAKKTSYYGMWASTLGMVLMLNVLAWNVDL